jgi:hypothetical protein
MKRSPKYAAVERIAELLERYQQRATYGAVAGVVNLPARSLMQGHPQNPRNSWIVSAKTHAPSGYPPSKVAPALAMSPHAVLDSSVLLAKWMQTHH